MTEPDVTLTDYCLAFEGALFALLMYARGEGAAPLRWWFVLFFGSLSLAAATGGTVHGFFLDGATTGYAILWPSTLIAIGATTVATWMIGAQLAFSDRAVRWISLLAAIQFAVYCLIVLLITDDFRIAIVNYLPAVFFLLAIFAIKYVQTRKPQVVIGLIGIVLTLLASFVQQAGVAIHPLYFNHNALYHVIQAVALLMIFASARWMYILAVQKGTGTSH